MPPLIPPLSTTIAKLRQLPLTIWMFIALAFMFVNASAFVPQGEMERFRSVMTIYMIMLLLFLPYAKKAVGYQLNLNKAIAYLAGGFVITVFVMTAFRAVIPALAGQTYVVGAPIYFLVLHIFVVAFSEEMIFRGALSTLITPIPAAVAFGVFHVSAYGGSISSIFVAIVAGLVFFVIMKKTNIWAAIGVHAGWNSVMLGIFAMMGVGA